MLLPFILVIVGLITAYLFRGRFLGGDAETTVVETAHRAKPTTSSTSAKAKESFAAANTLPSIGDTKSVTLVPPKMLKEATSSVMAAPQLAPVTSSASTNTAVPRVGPTDSEARAIADTLETQTPQAEQIQTPIQPSVSSVSGQTSSGGSSGSDDAADPLGKKKKSKSKKTSKNKKEGKDKKKKKKKSERGETPKAT